jgi:hypothetical protein
MQIIRCNRKVLAQDFQGYFTGKVPDYAVNYMGTGAVDSSQINSMFSRTNDALSLVNQFDSSLLSNVAFIFNFSKGGAYGVYLPALDRAIKTEALKKKLESAGYIIEVDNKGLLTAKPKKDEKTSEQIQQDIDRLYSDIESGGGTAFGINMNDVLSSARQDALGSKSPDPNIWEWMAVLHLGSTIVHEAIHSKGNLGEGPSETAEASFIQKVLPIVNEKYKQSLISQGKEEIYSPLTITGTKRHAKGGNWYKQAQHFVPQSFFETPVGSDLSGRFPMGIQTSQGMAGWSMLSQQDQSVPIERRLGREHMSKIPKDLDQANDIYELQLRKFTRDIPKLDPNATMDELLSEGHDKNRGYKTLEELLEEKRPKPIIVPLKKNASINKSAGLKLNLTPLMADEIAIDFEYYEEHYENPNDPKKQVEKNIYEKLTSGNFDFDNEELIMIGQTLKDISNKDIFTQDLRAQKQLFNVELQLGMWKPITDEQAKESIRTGINVRMSSFPKVNGIRYEYNSDWDASFGVSCSLPINKANSKIVKIATLFGWYNNLAISDGNTIPGLSDRVMLWDSAEEDFKWTEEEIRSQSRYNPEYDIKGFYYRWIDPRLRPSLWRDPNEDQSNITPSRRFGAKNVEKKVDHVEIIKVLSTIRSKIENSEIKSTRLIVSSDLIPVINQVFNESQKIKLMSFELGNDVNSEPIMSIWIASSEVAEEDIKKAETFFDNKSEFKDVALIEKLTGYFKCREKIIRELIEETKKLCTTYEIKDIYLSGGFARDYVLGKKMGEVRDLDFIASWPNQCIKIGGLLSEKLNVAHVDFDHKTMELSFTYKGVKANFRGGFSPASIKSKLEELNISVDRLNMEIYNRDFTINMMLYNVLSGTIYDPSKCGTEDLRQGILRTYFDAGFACKENPLIILRAIKLSLSLGFDIDEALQVAMIENTPLLFNKYSPEKLIMARNEIIKDNGEEAVKLFNEFGLEQILAL